ncbi:sensor histidine kinase [Pinisolibacter aquiterrae]|uniref:sensor histidine kinase n=1 Tax=Pinisolibacter aquiterrae TaxID=2815579 RepID=UPI001C3CA7D0|nr:HAMP domain-containing sensor histidine kinase [Pinisolibacter aquiterrae]MBV5266037.1 HAMP domain-containing histidine kinase [Pinisolibacter aquiterrae]MCC8237106.1 HAMP domain-containing histidine kinase [Pinisolibacter aquiterrae]
MADTNTPNPSLWWKLSWQLSLVFVAVVTVVIVGLSAYGAVILSPNVALEDKLATALDEALTRDPGGRIVVGDTPRLQAFKTENDRLWFVAATSDGEVVTYGAVPAQYAGLAPYVRLMKDADIRGAKDTQETASIDGFKTSLGEVRVMYGGNTDTTDNMLTMLRKLYPIYVPLLAISLPSVFFTIPRVVRRGLAGVREVAREASEIEPRRQEVRLRTKGIPKEIAPLVVAFNGVLDRLEREFRKRQRFLIDAAHELRTPIAIMQTRIEGMADGPDRERLLRDVARLGATAEQLLDFERNDQATDRQDTVDLVDVARNAVADLAPLAIAAGYEIAFRNGPDRLERPGNRFALSGAIGNLVRNAIDHGGNAGMISVSVAADGEIAVADEGPGIPAEHLELVFEPFYRVAPRSEGAGLGLSLVRQVVANHGGEVTMESGSSGTTVRIRL